LRQLSKFQYPNPFSDISEGANIRPVIFIFKLMLKFDGLNKFELGLCHMARNENTSYHESLIIEYRGGRRNGNIEKT
jgi:hypothetical protein